MINKPAAAETVALITASRWRGRSAAIASPATSVSPMTDQASTSTVLILGRSTAWIGAPGAVAASRNPVESVSRMLLPKITTACRRSRSSASTALEPPVAPLCQVISRPSSSPRCQASPIVPPGISAIGSSAALPGRDPSRAARPKIVRSSAVVQVDDPAGANAGPYQ